MNETATDQVERMLRNMRTELIYPDTPPIGDAVARRLMAQRRSGLERIARNVIATLLAFGVLMMIPTVRSAVIEWIRVGAVTLFGIEEEDIDDARPQFYGWIETIATRTALEDTVMLTSIPVLIPDPALGYGSPSDVFVHETADESRNVYLVWRDGAGRPKLALYLLDSAFSFHKGVVSIADVPVGESTGRWVSAPHMLKVGPNHYQPWFFVDGNVLLWEANGLTYRLETQLDVDAARKIAESLVPVGN